MLKVKNDINMKILEDFGFKTSGGLHNNAHAELWDGGIIKMWVDKDRFLHFNSPRYAQMDLIYKMHHLLEYTEEVYNKKLLSRPVLLEKNKELQNRTDKAIEYIKSTKYEWGDLDQDNEDYDIDVNKLLEILKGEQ